MSRRSQWESMRQEARSRVHDMDAVLILENTPNDDAAFNTPDGSGEPTRVRLGQSGGLEGRGTGLPQHDSSGKEKDADATRAKTRLEGGGECVEHEDVACRLYGAGNAEGSFVPLLDLHPARPLRQSTSAEMIAADASVLSNPPSWSMRDERHAVAKAGLASAEDTIRELSTVGSENVVAALQLELAQEKRKNILAEKRLLSLDEEIKALRAENTRLASSIGRNGAAAGRDSAADRPRGGDTAWDGGRRGDSTHMEQMLRELQEELDILKEYTKELEARLAERSNALEKRGREVEQKESRIRQLERIMADEMIRRSKGESAGEGAGVTIHPPTTTILPTAAADRHYIHHPSSSSSSHNNNNNGNRECSSGTHHEAGKLLRDKSIGKIEVPSVVYRVPALPRGRSESERPSGGASAEPLAPKLLASVFEEATSPGLPLTQEKPPKSASSASHQNPQTCGPPVTKNGGTLDHSHSHATPRHEEPHHRQYHRAGVSSVTATPRRASLISRKAGASITTPSMRTSRGGGMGLIAPASARQGSVTRKKSVSKTGGHDGRNTLKRHSTGSIAHIEYADDSLQKDMNPASLPTSRRSVNRPPPLETSVMSTLAMGTNTATLQHMDTRSVASTVRSRPRISHDDSGKTVIQASTTTVVTRSAKRRDSPVLVPQPRADVVESVPSDQPFVSEKFSTTTYRPNRLLRYHKGDSNTRSVTPPSA